MRQGEIAQLCREDFVVCAEDDFLDAVLRAPEQKLRPYSVAEKITDSVTICIYVRDHGTHQTKTGMERLVPVADKLMSTVTEC